MTGQLEQCPNDLMVILLESARATCQRNGIRWELAEMLKKQCNLSEQLWHDFDLLATSEQWAKCDASDARHLNVVDDRH